MRFDLEDITAPDWEAEGDCDDCGEPMAGKPGKVTFERGDYVGRRDCYRRSSHACGARHAGSIERCDLRKSDCDRLTADQRAQRLGVRLDPERLTASDVLKAIRHRHATSPSKMPEWLVLQEVTLDRRRVDAMALRLWSSKGLVVIAYEVKVSRSDFLQELRYPAKREEAIAASSQFWFATPAGLVQPEEVPEDCGLVEFGKGPRGGWRGFEQVPAPTRRLECVPPEVLFHIAWRYRDMQRSLQGRGIVL